VISHKQWRQEVVEESPLCRKHKHRHCYQHRFNLSGINKMLFLDLLRTVFIQDALERHLSMWQCHKWVHVTTARRVLRLRLEERPTIWRVAVNIFNKQSRTADKGWSSSLGVGRGANNSSPLNRILL
jgi:hypothetical protein